MPRCPAFFQEYWHTLCQCDTFQVLWHTFTPINTNKNRYYKYKQPCKILQSRWYNRQIWRIAGFFPVSSRFMRKRACALRRLSAPTNGCSCVIDFVLPSVACADDTVYTPGIWLDIEQGCAIQRVDIGDVQQIAFPGEQTEGGRCANSLRYPAVLSQIPQRPLPCPCSHRHSRAEWGHGLDHGAHCG